MKFLFVLVAALALLIPTGSTAAIKSTPTLSVSPDPVAVGGSVVITGEGFRAGEPLEVGVWGLPSLFLETDENGAFVVEYAGPFTLPGTGTAVALWYRGPNIDLRAEDTFVVVD